jgi:hypothetical protein
VPGGAGLAHLLLRRPRQGLLLALFPVAYFAIIGSGRTAFARYIVPVVPFVCLAAAYLLGVIARWVAARVPAVGGAPAVAVSLTAIVIAPSAWSTWQFLDRLERDDSRELAARWIAERFPHGATVGQAGRVSTYLYFPSALSEGQPRFTMMKLDDAGARPDIVVVPTSPLEHEPDGPRALGEILPHYTRAHIVQAFDPQSIAAAVYDRQDEFYLPLSGFTPIVRPGPTLEMFVKRERAP